MPNEFVPCSFPTYTCPKIDGLLRELREAQEEGKEGNAERVVYLLSDWDDTLEELRTANQQLRDAANGYKENRDEWMTFASTTEYELATVQDQLEDCKRELNDAQSRNVSLQNELEKAQYKIAFLRSDIDAKAIAADDLKRKLRSQRGQLTW